MRFSIILPIYNVEKYLKECVDSILKQTFRDYEIILVDDGSTDGSPELCDKLAETDGRIRVLHKKNGGLSDARNAGTNIAKGDYIIYIDSDDFIVRDDFLEKISAKADLSPDLIFYKYQKYYDDNKTFGECLYSYKDAVGEVTYADKITALVKADAFYGMAWIKAIKREIITENNISFEVGLLGEDMEWNYHIIFNSKSIEFIDEPFIAYRQRAGSITSTHKLKNLTDFIYVLEKWSSRIKSDTPDEELKAALFGSLAKYYSNLLVVYARLKDSDKKKYKSRIIELDWLLKYGMSRRPQTIAKIYRIFGFNLTVWALKILDKIKH